MTAQARALAALAEVNPAVAAAVRAVGAGGSGHPLPGLLGWLPPGDRLDVARACFLAIAPEPLVRYDGTPEVLADWMVDGGWQRPRNEREEARVHEAVLAWSRARDRCALLDLLTVTNRKIVDDA